MKNIRNLTTWKLGDYILQLSVVILGIVITFAVSNAVSAHAKAKEVAQAMQIIKNELELNKKTLQKISHTLAYEREASRYILRFEGQIEKADRDSLQMYLNAPYTSSRFIYSGNALEMLKSSALIPHVQKKGVILQILDAYNQLENANVTVSWYYTIKEKNGEHLNEKEYAEFGKRERDLCRNLKENIYKIWKHRIEDNYIRNILNLAAFGVNFNPIHTADTTLSQTIELLSKEYDLY